MAIVFDADHAEPAKRAPLWPVAIDWFERIAVAGLSFMLILRIVHGGGPLLVNGLLLFGEGLIVLSVLLRRTTGNYSSKPLDWAFAVGGTALPLLAGPGGTNIAPVYVSGALMLVGLLIQASAKVILFRSFGAVAANRGVKREGPYRFIRHPMYAGYVCMWLGFWLYNPTLRNSVIYALCLGCMAYRILAEECLLSADPKYQAFMRTTRYRLLPKIW